MAKIAMLLNLYSALLLTFIWSLLCTFVIVSKGSETDISCLKSFKDSVADRYGYLKSSWNFHNNTEGFICSFVGVECWHPYENRVLAISLSDMGLKGEFPWGLKHCTSLQRLDLSFNEFYGPIPSNVSQIIEYVTYLDLSSNNFSSEIPASIANCTFLNVLKLNNNQLTGYIPSEISLLRRINIFSVANNMLMGPVPNFINANFTRASYENNTGLCGGPLEPCTGPTSLFISGLVTGYVVSFVSVVVVFLSYCMPWVHVKNRNNMISVATMAMLLMRENMPNGNLYDWLHPLEGEAKIMGWPARVKIAIGLSRVLSWLHHECNIRIIHHSISSKCILLDQNFEPKLSNFGEAMLTCPNDSSELWEMAFIKEDVYSFGVVLFELITGVNSSKTANSSNNNGGIPNEWGTYLFTVQSISICSGKDLMPRSFTFLKLHVTVLILFQNKDRAS